MTKAISLLFLLLSISALGFSINADHPVIIAIWLLMTIWTATLAVTIWRK